jgi:hypothetical protein
MAGPARRVLPMLSVADLRASLAKRVAYLADPDGNLVMLTAPRERPAT